jgi:2'-5' RNA ligase
MGAAGVITDPDGKPIQVQARGQPGQEKEGEEEEPDEKEKERADETRKPPAKAVKAKDNSAMIALRIPDPIRAEIKDKYPFVDAETLAELHITLIYLGDTRTLNKVDIIRAASEYATYQAPIKGKLQGLARFINGQDVDPLVCTFDSPQMPQVYSGLVSFLDTNRIPYHKEHGFIPHMTLAYIPKDAEMPIETIEPIEINFSEIYIVSDNEWLPVTLSGYENKGAKWLPSLDELETLREWRAFALRSYNKGKPYAERYNKAAGRLPEEVIDHVVEALGAARTDAEITAAFQVEEVKAEPKPQANDAATVLEGIRLGLEALAVTTK